MKWIFTTAFLILFFDGMAGNRIFHRLSTDDGLSSANIMSVVQDQTGYLWVGTIDGLNRFDGKTFQTFYTDPQNAESIQQNYIDKLFADANGNIWITFPSGEISYYDAGEDIFVNFTREWLQQQVRMYGKPLCFYSFSPEQVWIGTENGLLVYDYPSGSLKRTESSGTAVYNSSVNCIYSDSPESIWFGTISGFTHYDTHNKTFTDYTLRIRNDENNIQEFPAGVNCIYRDKRGFLWIGTGKRGAFRTVNPDAELIFRTVPGEGNRIYQFLESGHGDIWIGNNKGVSRIHSGSADSLIITDYFSHPDDLAPTGECHITSMREDIKGDIWFTDSRFNQGLFYYSAEADTILRLLHLPENPYSISSNQVTTIYTDHFNNLWLGHTNSGLSYCNLDTPVFDYIFGYGKDGCSLSSNHILAVYEDSRQNLWIGTTEGLDRINHTTGKTDLRFTFSPGKKGTSLSGKVISSITEDDNNNLWIAYMDKNPDRIDLNTFEKEPFHFSWRIEHAASIRTTSKVCKDRKGNIWFTTSNMGLIKYDPEKNKRYYFTQPSVYPSSEDVTYSKFFSLCVDKDDHIWIASNGNGVRCFIPETETYINYSHHLSDRNSLLSDYVHDLYCDPEGRIWIGTNRGVSCFTKQDRIFRHYTVENGLCGNVVQSIQEAETGIFIIATNKGISRLNINNGQIQNYTTDNGLLTLEHAPGVSCKRISGEIVLGTNNGILSFIPSRLSVYNSTDHSPFYIVKGKNGLDAEKNAKPFLFAVLLVVLLFAAGYYGLRRFRHKEKEEVAVSQKPLSASEQAFVEKARQTVIKNIQNPQFDVDMFCSEMAMSRANLFRKLKATTGYSASTFTRHIRIEKAAELLKQKNYSITEIATMTGFSDPNYFSRCFKDIYGIRPSEY